MAGRSSPHAGAPVVKRGTPLTSAAAVLILLHGRGSTAEDILALGQALKVENVSYLAPQAADNTWYPNSFMAPTESNEPWLSSATEVVNSLTSYCEQAGVPYSRIAFVGFSQGACLATEYVARRPQPYGGLIAFTGGLVGPPGSDLQHFGSLAGMKALLSSGDPDPHVPWPRVAASAAQLTAMGAQVELLRHHGRPHTVLQSEILAARDVLTRAWPDL